MSTNSIIAVPGANTWAGRQVHYDGYPSCMGPALWKIYHRDGFVKMIDVLLKEHTYWLTIDPAGEGSNESFVEGYGDAPATGDTLRGGWVFGSDQKLGGSEWIHLMTTDSLQIGKVTSGQSDTVAFDACGIVLWDGPEPKWEAIEQVMQLQDWAKYKT